jgi:hypothetical protein
MSIPIILQNKSMILLNFSMTFLEHSQKISISSTSNRGVILRDIPIAFPFILPFPSAYLSSLLNPSTIKRKRRRDRGHPCPSPLLDLKIGVSAPLII